MIDDDFENLLSGDMQINKHPAMADDELLNFNGHQRHAV